MDPPPPKRTAASRRREKRRRQRERAAAAAASATETGAGAAVLAVEPQQGAAASSPAASRRRDCRRRQRERAAAAAATATATGASAAVLAVEPQQGAAATAPVTTPAGDAADMPAKRGRNKRRRSRGQRDRSGRGAAAADEAPAASPFGDDISTQEGSALQASCNLEEMAAYQSDNVLRTTSEKILSSDKTRKRNFQAGNKALKDSVVNGAASSSLARHEHSIRENEASSSKIFKTDVRFPKDSCTAQGTDMDYHKIKSGDLPGNLEEVYQLSLQKLEEYRGNKNVPSLNSSSLQEVKKRRKKRGRKKHNRHKKATLQDSPAPAAAISGLKPEEQRKKEDQNMPPMKNFVSVYNAKLSEPFGVNLEGTIENSCELGTNSLESTFENRYELSKSNLDCTNMLRNGLQEQYLACSSNSRNVNYLGPSHLAVEYMEKLKYVFSPGKSLRFPKKKLLILDLNGLLVDINKDRHNARMADAKVRGKLVFRRPYCDDFLNFCALNFELGIWSSRLKENVDSVVNIVMREFKPRLLFCWDLSKCTFTGHKTLENKQKPLVLKELRKLWNMEEPDLPWEEGDYSPSNTLLVDDSPYKALRNPPYTAIFPHSYSYLNRNDNSLGPGGDLRVYLQNLAAADDVQCFVRNNPFGQPFITESDPRWNFYAGIADSRCSGWDHVIGNRGGASGGPGSSLEDGGPASRTRSKVRLHS